MDRFFSIGLAFGLCSGIVAFFYGTQHPTNTLPPAPVITEVSALAETETMHGFKLRNVH